MTAAEKEAIREQCRKATTKAVGTVKLWKTEAERQQHLKEVAEAQANGAPF